MEAGGRAGQVASPGGSSSPPVWTVVLAGFCAFLSLYVTQPILPLLAATFQATKGAVSFTVTASTLGVALAAPFMGRLADRYGRRRVMLISALLVFVAALLAATSGSLGQLIFWRFVQGVFTPGIFAVTVAYVNDEWPLERIGSAMAAYVTGTVVGGFSGRATAGLVSEHGHWRWSFIVVGLIGLAATAAMWRWLPAEKRSQPDNGALFGPAADHLRNPALLARYAVGFCVLFSLVAPFTYVTFYLAAPPFSFSPALLGSIFVVYLVGAVLTPLSGRWVDRLGSRRMLMFAGAIGIAGIALTLVPAVLAVAAGLAICCTGVFIAQTAINRSLGLVAGHNRALAVGLYAGFYYLGGSVGASLPSLAWRAGGWPACVALIAAVQLCTVAIAWRGFHDPIRAN
jgi:MFS transporter, YNFM family, putative membrane transport protein